MKLVFWGKYLDTYLTDTLQRFAALAGESVPYVLVEERFHRRDGTSEQASKEPSQEIVLGKHDFLQHSSRILDENMDAVHIFLSFWGDKRLFYVLLKALWRRQQVGVIVEPYSALPFGYWKDEGWLVSHLKVLGRHIAYRLLWPLIRLACRGRLPCVLAVSPLAEEQLRRVGFREEVIYPFAYFVERKEIMPTQKGEGEMLHGVFCGSLIKRKGLDVAIAAVKRANSAGVRVRLDIYGPGVIDSYLPRPIPGIRYLGVYPQQQAQGIISAYDLLFVPSRHEGWGLVVNEALLQGVPVLASDRVGAGCLLVKSGAGLLFRSGDVVQLSALLVDLVTDRARLNTMAKASVEACERITPQIGADYLKRVLDFHFNKIGSLPEAAWLCNKLK